MEQIFDLRSLIEPDQIKMEGGVSLVGIFGDTLRIQRFHKVVEDWFEHNGCSYSVDEYKRYDKAYDDWKRELSTQETTRQLKHIGREVECNCGPTPEKPKESDYFAQERTPRLLTEVLAPLAKVKQIDRLPRKLLHQLAELNRANNASDREAESSDIPVEDTEASGGS